MTCYPDYTALNMMSAYPGYDLNRMSGYPGYDLNRMTPIRDMKRTG